MFYVPLETNWFLFEEINLTIFPLSVNFFNLMTEKYLGKEN